MANRLNWSLGHPGKGNYYKNGEISTWNTSGLDNRPHHHDVASTEEQAPGAFFYISPEGGITDGGIGFQNSTPMTDDQIVQEVVSQHPAVYDARDEDDMNFDNAPRVEMPGGGYGHAYNLLEVMSKVGVNQNGWADFHTELKIPRGIRRRIRQWVNRLDWPEGSTKDDSRTYHITILSMDEYDEEFADWMRKQIRGRVFHFKSTGIDIFGETVVLRLECPEWFELAVEWGKRAYKRGLSPHRFPSGPKAHISVGKSPDGKWPQGIPDPHVEFDTRMFNINKNSKVAMAWPNDLYHVSPASNHGAIQQHGLMGHDKNMPMYNPTNMGRGIQGNYAFDHPEDAKRYAIMHAQKGEPMDIWRIQNSGDLPLEQDPESHSVRNHGDDVYPEELDPADFNRGKEWGLDGDEKHAPLYYWQRPKPEDFEGDEDAWDQDERALDWHQTSPIAWRIKSGVPPESLAHHDTITPEYAKSLPEDPMGIQYDPSLPLNQAPEPYHNVQWGSPQEYQRAVNQFVDHHRSGVDQPDPVEELRKWLDSFSSPQAQVGTIHHQDYDQMQPQTRPPASEGHFVDPPSHPYKPYNWAEDTDYNDDHFGKVAGSTRKQYLEHARQLDTQYGPDTSRVVHEYPNGWTMRRLHTYADAIREGELMSNCLSPFDLDPESHHHIWEYHPEALRYEGDDEYDSLYGGGYEGMPGHREQPGFDHTLPIEGDNVWSLRDPDNLPHGTVDSNESLGRHNDPLKPQYVNMVDEFWNAPKSSKTAHGLDTFNCANCEEDITEYPCASCGYDELQADQGFKESEREWYDRAWSEPGSPRPFPDQPMHWRHDHSPDVKSAGSGRQGTERTADIALAASRPRFHNLPTDEGRRYTEVDPIRTSHNDSREEHQYELDHIEGRITDTAPQWDDCQPQDDLHPLWAPKRRDSSPRDEGHVDPVRRVRAELQDTSEVKPWIGHSWREIC